MAQWLADNADKVIFGKVTRVGPGLVQCSILVGQKDKPECIFVISSRTSARSGFEKEGAEEEVGR